MGYVCKDTMTIATSNNRKSESGTAHRCLKASYTVTLVGAGKDAKVNPGGA